MSLFLGDWKGKIYVLPKPFGLLSLAVVRTELLCSLLLLKALMKMKPYGDGRLKSNKKGIF